MAPKSWATMKPGSEAGAMPAKVSLNARPMLTAGFANEVDEVNQCADPTYAPTAAAATAPRPDQASAKISTTSPAVATTSPSQRCPDERSVVDHDTAALSYIRLASTAPATAPTICAGT